MAKAAGRIREYLRAVDVVLEVVDARIARSGRNPLLGKLAGKRRRVVALEREDLADPKTTRQWLSFFRDAGTEALAVDGRAARKVADVATAVTRSCAEGRGIARAMVVGIPNSGKSTLVNALLRRAAAKTEDRAGITRDLQWFRLSPNVELMDTPGVLPVKTPSEAARWKLAICGAVPSNRYDPQEVTAAFYGWLLARSPRTQVPDLQAYAARRGFVRRGGEVDYHNAARSYIRAFNEGVFGRISLESPDDAEAA